MQQNSFLLGFVGRRLLDLLLAACRKEREELQQILVSAAAFPLEDGSAVQRLLLLLFSQPLSSFPPHILYPFGMQPGSLVCE